MPRNNKQSVLLRQIELLKQLPTRGTGKTASELTRALNDAGYDINKRQVERDLNELMEAFALDKNDTSIPHGWKWVKGASVDLPGMTLAEALSLRLVEETIKPLVPVSMLEGLETRFRLAEKQLAAMVKENRKAKWVNKVRAVRPSLPLIPPVIDSTVLATVQDALLADLQIEVDYHAIDYKEGKQKRLHPLAMVIRGAVTYLIATAAENDDIRIYALHRIHKAALTDEAVKRPADFDLDEYIQKGGMSFGNGKTIRLSANISEFLARILGETPLSEDQKLKIDDNHTKLTATDADTWQLTWWILSFGDNIEVTAPVALRRKISGLLADAANQYSSESCRFELTPEQNDRLKEWLVGVSQKASKKQEELEKDDSRLKFWLKIAASRKLSEKEEWVLSRLKKPYPRPLPYYADGGGISFTFTPTERGVYCRATESITGEFIDLDDLGWG